MRLQVTLINWRRSVRKVNDPQPDIWRGLLYLRRRRTGQQWKKARLWMSLLTEDIPKWYLVLALAVYTGLWLYYAITIEQGNVTFPLASGTGSALSFAALETGVLLALIFGGLWGGEPPGTLGGADAQIWLVRGAPWRYVLLILLESVGKAALLSALAVVVPLPMWRLLGFELTAWSAVWLWVQGFCALGAAANVRWLANAFRKQAFMARIVIIIGVLAYGLTNLLVAGMRNAAPSSGKAAVPFEVTAAATDNLGSMEIGPALAAVFALVWVATAFIAVVGADRVSADEMTKRAELLRQMRFAALLGLGEERQAIAERLRGRSRLRRRSLPGYVRLNATSELRSTSVQAAAFRPAAVRALAWRDFAGLAKTTPSRVVAAFIIAGAFGWMWQKHVIPLEWAPLVALTGAVFVGLTLLGPLERDVRWPEQAKLLPLDTAEILLGHLRPAWYGLTAVFASGAVAYLSAYIWAAPKPDLTFVLAVVAALPFVARAVAASCAAGILSMEREYDRPLDEFFRTEMIDPLVMWLGIGAMGIAALAAFRLSGGSLVALVAAGGVTSVPVALWLERWGSRKLDRLWSRSGGDEAGAH